MKETEKFYRVTAKTYKRGLGTVNKLKKHLRYFSIEIYKKIKPEKAESHERQDYKCPKLKILMQYG
jgi:hypothetical protein